MGLKVLVHGNGSLWQRRLFTSWWPGSRKKSNGEGWGEESSHEQNTILGHVASDLLPPAGPHLLVFPGQKIASLAGDQPLVGDS